MPAIWDSFFGYLINETDSAVVTGEVKQQKGMNMFVCFMFMFVFFLENLKILGLFFWLFN